MSNPNHRTGSRRRLPREPENVSETKSGLLVVTKAEEEADELLKQMEAMAADVKKPKRFLRWRGVRHHDVLGIDVKTEVNCAGPRHKLNEEQRKARREDNKVAKEIRNRRKKRKHGR